MINKDDTFYLFEDNIYYINTCKYGLIVDFIQANAEKKFTYRELEIELDSIEHASEHKFKQYENKEEILCEINDNYNALYELKTALEYNGYFNLGWKVELIEFIKNYYSDLLTCGISKDYLLQAIK